MNEPVKNEIQLFEDQKIRVAWDAAREEWYFSIVDVVGVLTDSPDYKILEQAEAAAERRGQ